MTRLSAFLSIVDTVTIAIVTSLVSMMVTMSRLSLPLAIVVSVAPGPVSVSPLVTVMSMVAGLSISLPLSIAVVSPGSVSIASLVAMMAMVAGLSLSLAIESKTISTISSISVAKSISTISVAKTIAKAIAVVASVVGISISLSIGLSDSGGLGLGLPLAVVTPGPVSVTLVTTMMAVVVARLSKSDTGKEDSGDNKEFHDETSYQQQLQ